MDKQITEIDPQFVSDMLGSLDARVHKLTKDLEGLTELVARMHVDFYTHLHGLKATDNDSTE